MGKSTLNPVASTRWTLKRAAEWLDPPIPDADLRAWLKLLDVHPVARESTGGRPQHLYDPATVMRAHGDLQRARRNLRVRSPLVTSRASRLTLAEACDTEKHNGCAVVPLDLRELQTLVRLLRVRPVAKRRTPGRGTKPFEYVDQELSVAYTNLRDLRATY